MRLTALLCLLLIPALAGAAELRAPDQAGIDAKVTVEVVGEVDARSFVSIVAPGTAEGRYDDYAYTNRPQIKVPAPAAAGDYEVRLYDAAPPYRTLARRPIRIVMPEAMLQAPDQAPIGQAISIAWTGPSGANEYVTLVPKATPDGEYDDYVYTRGNGSGTLKLTTPATPGAYELRFQTGAKNVVIARRALEVTDVAATITAPDSVVMGASFDAGWTGPDNPRNYLTVVAPDAAERSYDVYACTRTPTVTLTAPEAPGAYEIRLLSADSSRVLARKALSVGGAGATVAGPASVEAGSEFQATWTGPDNELDYIALTAVGQPKKYETYTYTRRGSPLPLKAPATPGNYELHYLTGRTDTSLAHVAITVTPSATPGRLRVVGTGGAAGSAPAATVELILDASGSMLQRLGGERRIDIARRALDRLIQKQLPDGSPVALRVFGHRKAGACDTELLAALAPLDRAALGATVRGIEAKNLAKTPIAASLAAVATDLAGTEGQALVILVTDGEETCDGDPAAEIAKLRKLGFDVSLNIVGFAIDEFALEQDFRQWATLGGGAYFAATDAQGLDRSIAAAAQPVFTVLRDGAPVASGVVGGEAMELKPGKYVVSSGGRTWNVDLKAGEEATLRLE